MVAKRPPLILASLALVLAACSLSGEPVGMIESASITRSSLPDMGPAPELESDVWLNTVAPLRLRDLRGKVVALEMWTFGCINCQHVIPALKQWHVDYAEEGLVVIGNHFPEFAYEKDLEHLQQAVSDAGIEYAVAQDNAADTWRAYRNSYWPTIYLIDRRGRIRYMHIGEGAYDETERNIQALLAETYP